MRILLCYFILSFAISIEAQQYCYFTIQDSTSIKNQSALRNFASYEFKVNGVKIRQQKNCINVPIKTSGLDIIRVETELYGHKYNVFCKLKKGETYHIRYNPCSSYEIIPKSNNASFEWSGDEYRQTDTNARQDNYIRLISNKFKRPLWTDDFFWEIDTSDYKNNDTTKYYKAFNSGYCLHAINSFKICKTATKPKNEQYKDNPLCNSLQMIFFHSEKYSLIHDYESNHLSLKFEGYFDEKKRYC